MYALLSNIHLPNSPTDKLRVKTHKWAGKMELWIFHSVRLVSTSLDSHLSSLITIITSKVVANLKTFQIHSFVLSQRTFLQIQDSTVSGQRFRLYVPENKTKFYSNLQKFGITKFRAASTFLFFNSNFSEHHFFGEMQTTGLSIDAKYENFRKGASNFLKFSLILSWAKGNNFFESAGS